MKSFQSYLNDGLININGLQFSKQIYNIRISSLLPAAQWTNLTIMYRTFWTKKKESRTRRGMLNQSNDVCSNCIQEVETTTHLFYDCQIAQQIFHEIIRVVNDTRGTEVHHWFCPVILYYLIMLIFKLT